MKNRAKCKLCESIIESFHSTHYDVCKCGEISVDGGDAMRCYAKDFSNFLRVDDEGNIIIPIIKTSDDVKPLDIDISKPTKKDLIAMLENLLKSIEDMPSAALTAPATNYDILSFGMIILAIFKSDSDSSLSDPSKNQIET